MSENEEVILLDTDTDKSNGSLDGTFQVSDKTVPERTTKECASDTTSDNDNQLARR